jgi:hypothetical protein
MEWYEESGSEILGNRFSIRDEVLSNVNCQLRGFDDEVDVFSQMISPVHGFSVFHSTDQIVHHLCSTAQTFHCDKDKLKEQFYVQRNMRAKKISLHSLFQF